MSITSGMHRFCSISEFFFLRFLRFYQSEVLHDRGARSVELNENPADSSQLGIAIIGCGDWGMNYVRIFNDPLDSQVRAVCDQKAERLQEVVRRASRKTCPGGKTADHAFHRCRGTH